jgi:hypothetical protein
MKKQPFFAKFLENQFSEETTKNLKGGCHCLPEITLKAPSDQEDGENPLVTYQTMKAPSDQEEDCYTTTAKYPSDSEE